VLVWHAPLVPGEYDIVIDANRNGVYDVSTDGLDSGSHGFVVIPDVPPSPVPALAPHGIIALIGLLCVIGVSRSGEGSTEPSNSPRPSRTPIIRSSPQSTATSVVQTDASTVMARFAARLSIGKNPGTAPSPPPTPQSRCLRRCFAFRIAASGGRVPDADGSGDGSVTSLDALMILQAAAGDEV